MRLIPTLSAVLLCSLSATAADKPQFFGQPLPASGPKIGKRLPYSLPVELVNSKRRVCTTLEWGNCIISFVKELDKPTLELVRHLDRSQPLLAKHYRNLRVFVVWVGGDKKELDRWAKANKIANVAVGVIAVDARNLNLWRISRKSISTTVLMRRTMPAACFIDLTPGQFDDIEENIDEHFRRIRR